MNISAPGISIKDLLFSAKPKSLRALLPEPTVELIERMSPGLFGTAEANRVAVAVVDPMEALLDPTTRSKIIRLLSLQKARELCDKLGMKIDRSPYDAIEANIANLGVQPLCDFFGIVEDPRAPRLIAPTTQ